MERRRRAPLVGQEDLLHHQHSHHTNHLKEKEMEEQLLSPCQDSPVPHTARLKDA